MTSFRDMYGAVYIFENIEAARIKVGMTTGSIESRLLKLDDIWQGRTITCQICGARLLPNKHGFIPNHVVSGQICNGSNQLPFEKSVELAKSYLEYLEQENTFASGVSKGSNTRRIKTLKKRILKYSNYVQPKGFWRFRKAYYSEGAEKVELLTHGLLEDHLDESAKVGEVFKCTVDNASEAIETVLNQLEFEFKVRLG